MKDLYDGLIAPKLQETRHDWDNLSDDTCYVNPDPDAQARAEGYQRDRQKKPEDMHDVEKEAWKSWENCAKVCALEDVTDDEEAAEKGDDAAAVKEANNVKKRNRTCFQYRWNNEVCCTSRSFKLGAPKKRADSPKERWMSGWHLKGINDWIDAMGPCETPAWKAPEDP